MAGIPLSALRRALASLAGDRGVDSALAAPIPGAIAGGAFGATTATFDGEANDAELGRNGLIGAGIGAGLGAVGAGSIISRKLRQALAEAAAERGVGRAAVRNAEHADDAMRFHGMSDDSQFYDEAAQTGTPVSELRSRGSFEGFGERFQPGPLREFSNDELRAAGQRPSARYGSGNHQMDGGRANGMVEMQEMQAMRNALGQLRRSRAQAASQEELDDIDMQIAVLQRDLDIIPWD